MTENNIKNASVIYKAGKFRIQEDGQKGIENTYLSIFMETDIGKKLIAKNNIVNKVPNETPDFLFKTSAGKTIGLEITNIIAKTDKYYATAALQRIANKICQHFKKENGVALSILIDIYDERRLSPKWSDHISYRYDPGFKRLEVSEKNIKDAIIADISKEDFSKLWHRKIWIDLPPHQFIVNYDKMHEPYTSAHVNNSGMCIEDPFLDLQNTINDKNNKYKKYIEKCDECHLLVVSDDSSTGNFTIFSNKINSYEFVSAFKKTYLLDLGSHFNIKIIKLKTRPARA